MARVRGRFEHEIACPVARVFSVLADLNSYSEWLGSSNAFTECRTLTDDPPTEGTKYRDMSAAGELAGEIVTYRPNGQIAFLERGVVKPAGLSIPIEVRIDYTLAPVDRGTTVVRNYELIAGGPVGFLVWFGRFQIMTENRRVMRRLAAACTGTD